MSEEEYNELPLTREYLYKLIFESFDSLERFFYLKQNRSFILRVFDDSAKIAKLLEDDLRKNNYSDYSFSDFNDLLDRIGESIREDSFRDYIVSKNREKIFYKMTGRTKEPYKNIVRSIFNLIKNYQNNLIEKSFQAVSDYSRFRGLTNAPQTFLSYAYDDKGLTLGLFLYFLLNGGFLYVNWMWCGKNNNSAITKLQLEDALNGSEQFLFLRTLNSELSYSNNSNFSTHIRQWCAWEIGNYYTKKPEEKYYLNFYGRTSNNDLLSSFKVFRYVRNGRINK